MRTFRTVRAHSSRTRSRTQFAQTVHTSHTVRADFVHTSRTAHTLHDKFAHSSTAISKEFNTNAHQDEIPTHNTFWLRLDEIQCVRSHNHGIKKTKINVTANKRSDLEPIGFRKALTGQISELFADPSDSVRDCIDTIHNSFQNVTGDFV